MTREEQIEEYCQRYCDKQGFSSDGGFNIYSPMAIVASDAIKWADEHPKSPWQPIRADNLPPARYDFVLLSDEGITRLVQNNLEISFIPHITGTEGTCWTHWMIVPKLEEE